ncbi:FERM domain-containing protein 4A isoform X1 [Arapaima gigas]
MSADPREAGSLTHPPTHMLHAGGERSREDLLCRDGPSHDSQSDAPRGWGGVAVNGNKRSSRGGGGGVFAAPLLRPQQYSCRAEREYSHTQTHTQKRAHPASALSPSVAGTMVVQAAVTPGRTRRILLKLPGGTLRRSSGERCLVKQKQACFRSPTQDESPSCEQGPEGSIHGLRADVPAARPGACPLS